MIRRRCVRESKWDERYREEEALWLGDSSTKWVDY